MRMRFEYAVAVFLSCSSIENFEEKIWPLALLFTHKLISINVLFMLCTCCHKTNTLMMLRAELCTVQYEYEEKKNTFR